MSDSAPVPVRTFSGPPVLVWAKRHVTAYHITLAVAIGAATAGFGALILVLLLIATNTNILSLIE